MSTTANSNTIESHILSHKIFISYEPSIESCGVDRAKLQLWNHMKTYADLKFNRMRNGFANKLAIDANLLLSANKRDNFFSK